MAVDRRSFGQALVGLAAGLVAGRGVAQEPAGGGSRQGAAGGGVPVVGPDLAKLPYTLDGGVKVFHLTPEPVRREFLPGKMVDCWGFNGSMPGPIIEVNQGDRVRVHVHNRLPEGLTVHWHGLEVPVEMDGQPLISQPIIWPGEEFVYEFTLHQHGTFFYHSHMAMQEMMGLIGPLIIHPQAPYGPPVQRDFVLVLQEWAILPNSTIPNSLSMEFNWLTINGKAGPATTPMVTRLGERVRIRMINLGMDHHPMHVHGTQFEVTGTEGGRIPRSAWFPGNTVIVGVSQARDVEFQHERPGDWMLHCHLPHHMMNNMVSMVGPMLQAGGSVTGLGMEEGMGMIRQGHALSEHVGPGMGRGMGMTTNERPVSPVTGPRPAGGHGGHGLLGDPAKGYTVPGFPQDMLMIMDEAVAKPETHGMPEGWSGASMGMTSFVRVLEPELYDEVMRRVATGTASPPAQRDGHGGH